MFCYVKYGRIYPHHKSDTMKAGQHRRVTIEANNERKSSLMSSMQLVRPTAWNIDPPSQSNTLTHNLVLEQALELFNRMRLELKLSIEQDADYDSKVGVARSLDPMASETRTLLDGHEADRSVDRHMRAVRLSRRSRMFTAEENIVFMINIDCYVQILIDFIYRQLGIEKTSLNLDLCDEEGNMMKLFTYKRNVSAKTLLENRKTYYVVNYELDEDGNFASLEPIIQQSNEEESKLFMKVIKNVHRSKRHSGSSQSLLTTSKNSRRGVSAMSS